MRFLNISETLSSAIKGSGRRLVGNTALIVVMRMVSIGLSFSTSIALARLLSLSEYGLYNYILSWILLLQIFAELGIRNILVREISIYCTNEKWNLVKGIILWANLAVLTSSIFVIVISVVSTHSFDLIPSESTSIVFIIALLTLPLAVLTVVKQGIMRGLNYVVSGQIPELLVQPLVFFALLLVIYLSPTIPINLSSVMLTKLASLLLGFLIGFYLLSKVMPKKIAFIPAKYEISSWTKSILPFLFISCAVVINNRTDVLMLGVLNGVEDVGLYTVASRGAEFVSFTLIAANMSLSPILAKLFSQGEFEKFQKLVTDGSRLIFLSSFLIFLIFVIFGKQFLLLFGGEFVTAYTTLVILALGQLVNTATGPVSLILEMTGHARDVAIGVSISAGLNIVFNLLLIPPLGLVGAAIATASSLAVWNCLLSFTAYRKLKIIPGLIGKGVLES